MCRVVRKKWGAGLTTCSPICDARQQFSGSSVVLYGSHNWKKHIFLVAPLLTVTLLQFLILPFNSSDTGSCRSECDLRLSWQSYSVIGKHIQEHTGKESHPPTHTQTDRTSVYTASGPVNCGVNQRYRGAAGGTDTSKSFPPTVLHRASLHRVSQEERTKRIKWGSYVQNIPRQNCALVLSSRLAGLRRY